MSSESNIQAATLQDLRRAALFDPSTGICMPSKPGRECWNPIFNTALPDITAIANRITQHALTPEGRRILDERRAHDIPDINPFAPSRIRTRGFRLWDAAVHVPRSAFTQGKLLAIRDIQPVRRINSYWREDTQRALRRVEPIEPYRQLYRRRGPFIFDLLEDRHRILLQAAHVLAHHRGDHADLDLDPIDPVTLPTARLFQRMSMFGIACAQSSR